MEGKHCPTCNTTKPINEFAKARKTKDGLNWQCRACHSVRMKTKRVETVAKNRNRTDYPDTKRCSDCEETKDRDQFSMNAAISDGLNQLCRSCDGKRAAILAGKYKKKNTNIKPVFIGMKLCPHCNTEKPISMFNKSNRRKYGISTWCKVCAAEGAAQSVQRNREHNKDRNPHESVDSIKECSACHELLPIIEFGKNKCTPDGLSGMCQSCKKVKDKKWQAENRVRIMFNAARSRSKLKRLPFSISAVDIVIPERCPVLGIQFGPENTREDSPSLDRIVPELGYVKGNVIVTSLRANRLKSDATLDELKMLVKFYESL